jgi:hypothetical protein
MKLHWQRIFVFVAYTAFMLAAMVTCCSCGQKHWTKRGYKNGWIKSDTITETIYTESAEKDTIFKHSIFRDTVVLKENKLTVKYFYNNSDSTVYLSGKCDSDTLYVDKYITKIQPDQGKWYNNWPYWLIIGILFLLLWAYKRR